MKQVIYHVFGDPAGGGKGGDAFGAAIAHAEDKLIILDGARRWPPPFSPTSVVAEAADWVKSYGVTDLTGDRWSGELIRELFREKDIRYVPTEQDKSQIYLEFHRLVNAGRVRLLDLPELLRELRGLERRRGSEGRDKVDHRRGSHDDLANAVAGACVAAAHGEYNSVRLWPTGTPYATSEEEHAAEEAERKAAGAAMIRGAIAKHGIRAKVRLASAADGANDDACRFRPRSGFYSRNRNARCGRAMSHSVPSAIIFCGMPSAHRHGQILGLIVIAARSPS